MKNKRVKQYNRTPIDTGIMLICLILAFFAWQIIRRNTGFEIMIRDVGVDVEVPDGWAVSEKSVHKVNIIFRGSREDIRYLNNEQLRVVIPISEPSRQSGQAIPFSPKYLRNPTDASVVRFSPSEIMVRLDREAEKKLPVKAKVEGELPEGIDIERIICSPASVKVVGARKILEEMDNIYTAPINMKDRFQSFTEGVPIVVPSSSRMRVEPDWVSVKFLLVERSATRELKNIPVEVLCSADENRKITIEPRSVNITLKGKPDELEKIRKEDILVFIRCTDLKECATYDLPVKADLPKNIKVVSTEPTAIHVEIRNL